MSEGVEVWRGRVNPWEVDSMGHLNVRYYGTRLTESLIAFAAAVGLPFRAGRQQAIAVREQHNRFLREARSDMPLHMTAGVLEVRPASADLLFQLLHSLSGDPSATFRLRVELEGPGGGAAWPEETAQAMRALSVGLPGHAAYRGVTTGEVRTGASLAEADRMGLRTISAGAFDGSHCDVFGRMKPDQVIARISDGMSHMFASLGGRGGEGPLLTNEMGRPRRLGGAVLEYRVMHWETPVAGDRFVVRSGVASVEPRFQRLVHWVLDPGTGRPWATAEAISISMDLEARKVLAYTDEHRARLESNVTPGLGL